MRGMGIMGITGPDHAFNPVILSSGVHAWHDKFYYRRMRLGKNESMLM
jgi:hypothetical protein